ncbi:MAG: hypothetical protein LBJ21_02385 [Acidobacteriota bacterium]|jgi:hypothetical protein|nr:hypothetical protein [Acidobacteriota bacterium]
MNNDDSKDIVSMNQVRDLLFGTQLRDIETRFQRQEARFQREVADAKEALKARLDSLENFMRSETASLVHRINTEAAERDAALKTEQRERAEAFNTLAGNIAAAEKTLERRIAALSSTLDNAEQEIRKLMQSETNSLNNKIDEKYAAALNVISETASQIRHDMVNRSTLSNMFTEMAVKLSNQWSSDLVEVTIGENQQDASENPGENQQNEGWS